MACLLHVMSDSVSSPLLRPAAPSLQCTSSCTAIMSAFTHSQPDTVWKTAARCCSAESLKDKWSWVLTMAVILWRGRGAMSLYSANLITDLLFACVSTQCNLKATPGLLGDAKTACQSTGTPPKWIKVAIQVCPDLGEMCTLVSALRETSWIQSFITESLWNM